MVGTVLGKSARKEEEVDKIDRDEEWKHSPRVEEQKK